MMPLIIEVFGVCAQDHDYCFVSLLMLNRHFRHPQREVGSLSEGVEKNRLMIGTGNSCPHESVGRAGRGRWPEGDGHFNTGACHRTSATCWGFMGPAFFMNESSLSKDRMASESIPLSELSLAPLVVLP